jgi:hypothetical protein
MPTIANAGGMQLSQIVNQLNLGQTDGAKELRSKGDSLYVKQGSKLFVNENSRAQHQREAVALVREGIVQEYGISEHQAGQIMRSVLGHVPTSITAGEANKLHQVGLVAQKFILNGGMDKVEAFKLANAISSGDTDTVKEMLGRMPNTQQTVDTLRAVEDHLVDKATRNELDPPVLTKAVHEEFFKKKTEALESIIDDKVSTSNNPKLGELAKLPKEQYWKTMIDGSVHDKDNKHFYDRSKGFMGSMMRGLDKIVSEIDRPLSTSFVKELHQCATEHVTNETLIGDGIGMQSHLFQETGLKKTQNSWGVCKDFSPEGMRELQDLRDELDGVVGGAGYFSDDEFRFQGKPDTVVQWRAGKVGSPELQGQVETLMDHVIAKGQREIQAAGGDVDRKIGAIVDTCRGLGIIHPFKDANGRLMMFMVLNKMLMENGLPPTILQNQGHMVGKSRDELVALIKEGQQKVKDLY